MRSGTTVAGDSGTTMVFAYITPSESRIKASFPRLTAAGYRANVSKLSSTEEGVMSEAASAPAAGGELGERRLGTIHAVAQSLAIGPMFSVALVLALVSNPDTGSSFNATLSVLVAGLGVLAIAYAIALFARRYAGAGAVYEYLTHGAHPAVGVFTAGLFFVGTLFLGGGGIYLGLGMLTKGFWAQHMDWLTTTLPAWWVFALFFLVLVL